MCFVLFEINDNNFYTEQTLFIRKKTSQYCRESSNGDENINSKSNSKETAMIPL